ncbi:MAG: ATP-dependent Clp protease adaptor ClpS, partial [Bacteroidetes bacterium]|nr:ATP-dependent Clp protease adaptor ClpS [Bacteroidota bacterium]
MAKKKKKYEQDVLTLEQTIDTKQLLVHNDEVNTFDWVIDTLIEVCKHQRE